MQINSNQMSFYDISKTILHNKNKLQVYNGLKPALLRHCIYTMLRINIYETLRDDKIITNKFIKIKLNHNTLLGVLYKASPSINYHYKQIY